MTKSEVSAVPSPANAASLASNPSGASFPPIAVIGVSALFPRAASKEQFWANIRHGVDAISEVPSSHWNPDDYFNADPKSPDRTYARRGGFLAPVEFDPLEFGIAPTNVEAIDTSQLLGLVGAKRALQDAGYGSDRQFDRSRVACILGVTGTLEMVIPLGARLGHPRWRKALREAGVPDDVAEDVVTRISESYVPWQENSFPGLLGNVVAGRIANRLDLHGTNCVVDAACASSLSAIHLATLELASGRSDLAVSGGVDTFNDIFMYMCFSKTPALSPTGDARPFSDAADGTALGEGVGMVVLKRLADAQRDGDRVYAVIRGIGTSSDGSGTAVYAPKKEGQIRCLLDAYRTAGVDPSTIELAEAHGTGTKVGDATEIAALVDVYGRSSRPRPWCAVGSIKSQIGHTKAAAGVAGLLKCVLALTHKVLPPTIKVERPPAAMLEPTSPFYVNTSARPWIARREHPRRAALSAFGFGGSNFHCVLEEAEPVAREVDWDDDVELVTLSASERDALAAALRPWQELATQRAASSSWSDPWWQQCARAAAQSRTSFHADHGHRLCFVVQRDSTDLPRLISNAAQQLERRAHEGWSTPEGVTYGVGPRRGSLAVLFPGQGAQYPGMLRDLACAFPELQGVLAEADQAYREFAREGSHSDQTVSGTVIERLSDAIYPPPAFSDEARQRGEQVLRATQVAQPAIGAVSLGALAILERFGVTPELVAGHSYGELTALCASQRFEKSALYRLSMLRGRLMAETQDVDGGMLALGAPLSVVEEAIREHAVDLVIANRNAPNQVVLSGRLPEIDRASQLFARKNIRGRKLAVAGAFHSPLFQRAGQRLRQALDDVPFRQSRMPVYANTTAREYPSDASDARDLLAHQVSRPVEFVQEIENLHQAGARLFLEVGPGGVLTGLVSSILAGREFQAVAIDASNGRRRGQHDLALALAQLASFGYAVRTSVWKPATGAVDTQPAKAGTRLTIPICGANYVRPRAARPPRAVANISINTVDPTSRPAMDMIAPLTDDRPVASVAMTPPLPQPLPEPQSRRQTQPVGSAPSSPRAPLNGDHAQGSLSPAPAPTTSGPTAGSSSAVPSDQGDAWQVLSQLAESTARLHEQFLRQQTATLLTIERLLRDGVTPAPARVAPTVSAPVVVPPAPAPAPAPAEPAASVAPTPVALAPTPAPVAPVVPAPVAAPAAVVPEPPAASSRLSTLLLSVVSQKTGYPVEMLNLSMSLDQDLGIDSIKRVEILSALQEQAPELPAVQPEQLGSIHTLNDIVALLAAFDAPAAAPVASVNVASVAAAPVAVPPAPAPASGSRLSTLLLSVVSQKTGYPVEMLNLSMSLDQDLGIDSIKRVEILSALQEQAPELPAVQPEQLGSIHTLNDIVALLAAFDAPAQAPVSPAPVAAAPVAVAPATAPASDSRLSTLLLSVVSQKTGYPVEMLNLSMSLDQDLGIDSIKRVEILSALQEQAPELPAVQPEQLGSIHTLNDIVALLAAFDAPASPTAATSPAVQTAPAARATPALSLGVGSLSIQRLAYRPLGHGTRAALRLPVEAEVWILDDGTDFVCELASALRDRRLTPRIIAPEALRDQPRPERLAGLILTQRATSTTTARELWPAIAALQTAGPALRQMGRADGQAATVAFLAGIVRLDGQFAVGGQSRLAQPEQGALAGLVKTARSEWPDVRCKVLDVATDLPAEALANAVADELLLDGPIEVGLSQGKAGELVLIEQPALAPTATLLSGQLGTQDVVLVTGGARGVTAAASLALAKACVGSGRAAPTFVLWGRSAVPAEEPVALRAARTRDEVRQALLSQGGAGQSPRQLEATVGEVLSAREIRQTLAQLQVAGVRAVYQSVDVTSSASVTEALAQVSRQFGAVALLMHGAGVLEDRKIENKTYEQLARVYDTKVLGLKHVLAAIDPVRLRGLVLFSSFTGRFGRTGQCDYAMANEALNKLGQDFAARQPQCRVVSFNWGPWAGGMVTPALEQLFAREGVGLIPLAEGAAAVVQELSRPVGSADAAVEVTVLAAAPGTTGQAGAGPTAQAQQFVSEQSSPASVPLSSAALLADGRVSFEVPLSIATVPVLADHVVGGQAVLPLALSIEWLAAAAMHRHPGLELHGVQKLQVRRAVRVGRHESLAVQLVCGKARREGAHFVAPTQLVVQQPHGAQVHLEADVWLGSAPPRLAPDATALPVTDSTVEAATAYGEVLFHGPRLQGLTQISTGAEGLTAQTLNEEDPRAWMAQPWRPRWLTVPLAIDGALQALIVWTQQRCGMRSLPMAIARVDVGAMPTAMGSVPLTITGVIRERQAQRVRADFELRSASGEVVARLIGVEHILDGALAQLFAQRMLNSDT